MSTAHRWRSQLLGERIELDLPAGPIEAFRRGQGPPIVFAHGWLANANLWRNVVDRLADRFTCIALDLPLGAHRLALPEADLSPEGCGALITAALGELDLENVTLVGNDSGGAYSQIATARDPERIGRLVLNSCETPYDPFPPPPFDGLPALARDPAALGELLGALRDRAIRTAPVAFGLLVKHGLADEVSDSYALPCVEDEAILADTARVMAGASTEPVHAAGHALIEGFAAPVLFAWSPEDRVFPLAHAERYAKALADGRIVLIEDAYSFTPEDQPAALVDALATFVRA
jgi:pimeloyl-ACP methyl ester carboxylesterase